MVEEEKGMRRVEGWEVGEGKKGKKGCFAETVVKGGRC
jgi:hypothetical protein